MASFSCDFHIHSALSPCGSLEMSPRDIVVRAKEATLDVIAITDHNMVENAFPVHEVGIAMGLTVLFGMEIQTEEEIHFLAIFDDYIQARHLQDYIYNLLPPVPNDTDFYGDQAVVDSKGNILRFEDKLLINSVQLSIEDGVRWVKDRGGLAIASHIDSNTYSIISQLGFVPDNIDFDAYEVRNIDKQNLLLPLIPRKDVPFVSFSDAHYLADIGRRRTIFDCNSASCRDLADALKRHAVLQQQEMRA